MNPIVGNNNNNAASLETYLQGLEVLAAKDFPEFVVAAGSIRRPTKRGYLLSLVGDSIWLQPHEIRYLMTEGNMNITNILPPTPQPPALYMVPTALVLNGFEDGYEWHQKKKHHHRIDDDGPNVIATYEYQKNVPPGPGRVNRRIYHLGLGGRQDVSIIHYKVTMLDEKTGKLY